MILNEPTPPTDMFSALAFMYVDMAFSCVKWGAQGLAHVSPFIPPSFEGALAQQLMVAGRVLDRAIADSRRHNLRVYRALHPRIGV